MKPLQLGNEHYYKMVEQFVCGMFSYIVCSLASFLLQA